MRLLSFWVSHREELAGMVERHLFLVLWSTAIATAIGLPAGVMAAHRPRIGRPLLAAASIAQTIPSLALLGFLLPLPFIGGIGPRIAIVALILYALLPIVRSTAAGLHWRCPQSLPAFASRPSSASEQRRSQPRSARVASASTSSAACRWWIRP
jgi:ABC-type proline/glycine betaine transport system permease subunit